MLAGFSEPNVDIVTLKVNSESVTNLLAKVPALHIVLSTFVIIWYIFSNSWKGAATEKQFILLTIERISTVSQTNLQLTEPKWKL